MEELEQIKLKTKLNLKQHHSIADAVADLGVPDEIGRCLQGFSKTRGE